MFRPAVLFIGLRYTRAKNRNHFISFISLMSMLGIALGIMVLITVLSVMNGFDKEIKKRVFSMVPAISIGSTQGSVANFREVQMLLQKNPAILASAPFINGQTMLTNEGFVQPAMLMGISPPEEKKVTKLSEKMIVGSLQALTPNSFGIVLGEDLANRLNVAVGDKITLITTQVSVSPAGLIPRHKRFTLVGLFRAGGGFGFDAGLAFINLEDAQKLFQMGSTVTGLHARIKNVYAAAALSHQLSRDFGESARVSNWTEQFGEYFHAIKLEKTMMFFILLLIIAVAAFNLICTLVMVVNEKKADIAILRTLGATPRMIMGVFIVQGAIIGIVGTFLGILSGTLLAYNVTEVVNLIEKLFHVQFLSSSVYFVNYLPSEIEWGDVWRIGAAALLLSLLATIYPAWRAAGTTPVEALRYE